jgi:hypothetical protein
MNMLGWKALLVLITVLLLSSCSGSLEDELKETSEAVESEFTSEPKEANHSNEDIEYHLPFGVKKEKETPNNILLENGSKTYILFYNQHEDSGSKVIYESTLKQHDEWDYQITFEEGQKFGYLLVKQMDEDVFQVVTGIGGVKVTTETNKIKADATTMMSIAKSVKTQ